MAEEADVQQAAAVPRLQAPPGGDAALYARLVAVGFTGPDFDAVADAFARYAYPILRAWLVSGQIVEECARKKVRGTRRLAAGLAALTREDVEDLVQDTLLAGLRRFARDGRAGTGWSPQGGAALRTYFLGGCILSFGDVYRVWEGRESRYHEAEATLPHPVADNDPADITVLREELADTLPPPGRARTAVLLSAAGYSHPEIARTIGEGTTARAVEGLLHRHRKILGGGKL